MTDLQQGLIPVGRSEKATTRMGKMIEQIWIRKTSWTPRADKLACEIWT